MVEEYLTGLRKITCFADDYGGLYDKVMGEANRLSINYQYIKGGEVGKYREYIQSRVGGDRMTFYLVSACRYQKSAKNW